MPVYLERGLDLETQARIRDNFGPGGHFNTDGYILPKPGLTESERTTIEGLKNAGYYNYGMAGDTIPQKDISPIEIMTELSMAPLRMWGSYFGMLESHPANTKPPK